MRVSSSCLLLVSALLFSQPAIIVVSGSSNPPVLRGDANPLPSLEEQTSHAIRRLAQYHAAPSSNNYHSNEKNLSWLMGLFYTSNSEGAEDNDVEDEEADYIIEFSYDLKHIRRTSNEIAKALGKHPSHVSELIHGFTLSGITRKVAAQIQAIPGVLLVEKDDRVTMDGMLRHVDTHHDDHSTRSLLSSQETPWGVEQVGGGQGIKKSKIRGRAFIIDTGVDVDHPDLNVHPTLRYSAFNDDSNDENGHGTHVSGIIGALDNNFGVVGVAPGAVIIPVKVLDADGSGSMSEVIKGIEWVAKNGQRGDVANLSLSGSTNEALDKAVRQASRSGVRFILSAGNNSSSATTRSPSRTNNRRISTIAAVDKAGKLAWFSNTGKPPVDYVAPGVEIKSTFKNGVYATMDGTSMAAPHAAGVWLLSRPKRQSRRSYDDEGKTYRLVKRQVTEPSRQ